MTRLEIAARLLPNVIVTTDATWEAQARIALKMADALLAAAAKKPAAAEKPAACAGCNGYGEVSAAMQDGSRQTDACPFCAGSGRAKKSAEVAPVVTGGIQYDPEGHALVADGRRAHVDPDGWFGFANKERAGVYVEARGLESARRAVRAMRDAGIAAVRGEAAAAPTVAAVEFNEQDRAEGHEWFAFHATDRKRVSVTIDLRPGEDAGVTTATILAAVGRGP